MSAAALAIVSSAQVSVLSTERSVDITVCRIEGGKIARGTIRSKLPDFANDVAWFAVGPVRDHSSAAVADSAETLRRCAPWLTCYVGPFLYHRLAGGREAVEYCDVVRLPDGGLAGRLGGLAWRQHQTIFVALSSSSHPGLLGTLHHEVWHAVEDLLPATARAVVDRAVERGMKFSSSYYNSGVERRARLYDAWAQARIEGWRPSQWRRSDVVFEYVFSGRMARDVERRGAAGDPLPPHVRAGRIACRAVEEAGIAAFGLAVVSPLLLIAAVAVRHFVRF